MSSKMEWFCPRCIKGTKRKGNRSICIHCDFYLNLHGLSWCSVCGETKSKKLFNRHKDRKSSCRLCRSKAEIERRKQKNQEMRPDGYVPVCDIDFGYSKSVVCRAIKIGWLEGLLWRSSPNTMWWVKKLDVYPPRPKFNYKGRRKKKTNAQAIPEEGKLPE